MNATYGLRFPSLSVTSLGARPHPAARSKATVRFDIRGHFVSDTERVGANLVSYPRLAFWRNSEHRIGTLR